MAQFTIALDRTSAANSLTRITFGRGSALADTGAVMLSLSPSLTKSISSAWTEGNGNGGLDVGSSQKANRNYSCWMIHNGIRVDALFSLSPYNPVLPEGYIHRLYVGTIQTDASGNIKPFRQSGDYFAYCNNSVYDLTGVAGYGMPQGLQIPSGRKMEADIYCRAGGNGSTPGHVFILDPDLDPNPVPPTTGQNPMNANFEHPVPGYGSAQLRVMTDTAAQVLVYSHLHYNCIWDGVSIFSRGWRDHDLCMTGRPLHVITYGCSVTRIGGWQIAVEDRLNAISHNPVRVTNRGWSGATSSTLLTNIACVVDENPDIIVLEPGCINDASTSIGISQSQSLSNHNDLVDSFRSALPGVLVVLMTMNPVIGPEAATHPDLADYYQITRDVAAAKDCPLVDNYAAYGTMTAAQFLNGDGVHPTMQAGRDVIGPGLAAVIANHI